MLVQNGLRMVALQQVALQQADGSVRACFLAKEEQRQASGVVLTAPDSEALPVPNGETCTLTGR